MCQDNQNNNNSQQTVDTTATATTQPGFFRRHWKSITSCTVAALAVTAGVVYFIYKK